jgi:hypothetical protein
MNFLSSCLLFVFPGVYAKLCDTIHNWSKTTSKGIVYNVYTNSWLASQNQGSIKYNCSCAWLGLTPEGKWGKKGLGLLILNFGTRRNFTPRPLYPRTACSRAYCIGGCMDPRAGLEDSEEINQLPVPGMEPWSFDYPASSLVAIPTKRQWNDMHVSWF